MDGNNDRKPIKGINGHLIAALSGSMSRKCSSSINSCMIGSCRAAVRNSLEENSPSWNAAYIRAKVQEPCLNNLQHDKAYTHLWADQIYGCRCSGQAFFCLHHLPLHLTPHNILLYLEFSLLKAKFPVEPHMYQNKCLPIFCPTAENLLPGVYAQLGCL